MRFRPKKDRKQSALDITPLVDVVFLLLIFFMLSFGSPISGSQVDLPESTTGMPLDMGFSCITITKEKIMLDSQEATLPMLVSIDKENDVVILAHRDVSYSRLIEVLDVLRSSDHRRISLGTKPVRNTGDG
ncbi:MAG: biopolymer transporter ExbD [Thermodesulfobacteriota bacterium]|nr:biopolymer transporter ExbD [Thermodesulfobacteriota bacterium]